MWRKIVTLVALSPKQKWLCAEAFFYLGLARILKALPFAKIAPGLGNRMVETSLAYRAADEVCIKSISRAVRRMSRYTLWESQCLVMAIAAMKMLQRRGIESTLYLGTAKDSSGKMIAHAWLRSGPFYLTGFEEMRRFTVVGMFGKRIEHKEAKGAIG